MRPTTIAAGAAAIAAVGMWPAFGLAAILAADPPPSTTSTTTTTTTVAPAASTTTRPALADTNVYRTADGHCFGMSPMAAAEKGLQPDPGCVP